MILTRQDLPVIDRNKYLSADGALKGGYVLADCEGMPEIILIATGSEVYLCIDAYEQLKNDGIKARVVSLPCWSLFDKQPAEYRESVLPKNVKKRIAVEAGSTFGWSHYTGNDNNGRVIGMKTFGASANYKDLYKEFGITVEAIIKTSKELLLKNRK